MRPKIVLVLVLPCVLALFVASAPARAAVTPDAAFDTLKALVGTWKADVSGRTVTLAYRLVSSDSVLVETYTTVFAILEADFGLQCDFDAALRGIHRWAESPRAFAQIGVHLACYRRSR